MENETKEQWLIEIEEQLDAFYKLLQDKVDKEQQQMEACEKKTELETKLTQEMNIHSELTEKLAELNRRVTELDRVCAAFETVSITDSDRNRLDNAKESYQLAKELTGIRLNFSAPPNVAKGYIKSEHRRILQSFEVDMSNGDSEALWNVLNSTFSSNKENAPCNK